MTGQPRARPKVAKGGFEMQDGKEEQEEEGCRGPRVSFGG